MSTRYSGAAAIDSQIFIWAVKQESSEGQVEMIEKARSLIKHLSDKKVTIVVSAIVLAECIVKMDDDAKVDFVSMVKAMFRVVAFDSGAVIAYSRVANRSRKLMRHPRTTEPQKTTQGVKVDCFVLASAIASGAGTFYTCDAFFEKVAANDIDVIAMPDYRMPKQLPLLPA